MKELGSKVVRQAEDKPTQPNFNPIYRTWRPVVIEQTSRSSAQEIDHCHRDVSTDEDVDADRERTGRPVGGH